MGGHRRFDVYLGNRIFVTGGYDGEEWRSDVVELDLELMTWTVLGQMPEPRGAPVWCDVL